MREALAPIPALLASLCMGACAASPRPVAGMLVEPTRLPMELLPGSLAWCKYAPGVEVPRLRESDGPITVLVHAPEGTFVVSSSAAFEDLSACIERDLAALRLTPTADPIVGTIATITRTIALAKVSVEVVTVAETDYFLVPRARLREVVEALRRAGYSVHEPPS